MNNDEITKELAKRLDIPPGQAAERLDQVVREIVEGIRRGENVHLPGLGTFQPDDNRKIKFSSDKKTSSRKTGR